MPADAHAVVMVALRTRGLRRLVVDEGLAVLRLLADRRDELSRTRAQTLNRLHRLLAELIPGGAPRHLTALQARALLASVRSRDLPGRTRRELAGELVAEVQVLDGKLRALKRRLAEAVTAAGSGLMASTGSARPARRESWPTLVTWPGSPTATTSHPGPGPPRSTRPPARRSATGCLEPATGGSTTCSTSPASCRSGTTLPAGPTTGASSPRARRR